MMRYLAVLAVGLIAWQAVAYDPITATITTHDQKTVALSLETATTPAERASGLMQRKAIEHDGMIFLFPKTSPQAFWMKDTFIPLDLLFVDASNTILYIGHGVPLSEDRIGPREPVAVVIELAGGRAKQEGIRIGDKLAYDLPPHLEVR